MSAILWPLVVLLLGSGALAFGFRWLKQSAEVEALAKAYVGAGMDAQAKAAAALDIANQHAETTRDLDDRLKRLELAQEFRT